MNDKYLTVTEVNKYLKYKFDTDENLQTVYLKGEISNFKSHTSGHLYFTLKDEQSRIMAIMFKTQTSRLIFKPIDGSKVMVIGKIGVYEANGAYQIYVEEMLEDGVGNLYLEFEKLKKKLELLGYFDETIKKKIPLYPRKIGVITASTGAAIRDIITTINRRYKCVELFIFPCLVQGIEAKEDICKQLELANTFDLDLIILGRGGGSIEDLWAFNEECVAEAIFKSNIPIISAVGHEIDFTIADFVADLRAPTPTAAAELAVPNKIDVINFIKQLEIRATKSILNIINLKNEKLCNLTNSYVLKNPSSIYEIKAQKLDNMIEKIQIYITNMLKEKTNKYINILTKLETLNPILTIKRGYAIVKQNDKIISSINDVIFNDNIDVILNDGKLKAKIFDREVK